MELLIEIGQLRIELDALGIDGHVTFPSDLPACWNHLEGGSGKAAKEKPKYQNLVYSFPERSLRWMA